MGVGSNRERQQGRGWLPSRWRDVLVGTILVCAVATAAQWTRGTDVVREFEWEQFARFSKARYVLPTADHIQVIEVDNDAYQDFARKLPMPRNYLAKLITTICTYSHPKAIGVDVLLDGAIKADERVREQKNGHDVPVDEDQELEDALKLAKARGIPVVLTCEVSPTNNDPSRLPLLRFAQYCLLGNVEVKRGPNGDELREVDWIANRNGKTYLSFAAALATANLGLSQQRSRDWIHHFEQRRGRYANYIVYPGYHGTPFEFSFTPSSDINPDNRESLPALLDKKIVLIGANTDLVRDSQLTPMRTQRFPTSFMPGVYVQAYALLTLMTPGFAAPSPVVEWLLTAITGGFFLFLLYRVNALRALLIVGALLIIVVFGTLIWYAETGNTVVWALVSNLGPSLIAIFGCALAWWIRRTLYLRRCFGSFVTKPVLRGIGSVNDLRDFRPTTANTSVMFCDLIGFSKVCRHLTAEQAMKMANHYLEPVAEAVERHGGIVDKYTGDGCLAFFGLPLPGIKPLTPEESAYQAARAGLDIYQVMQKLRVTARSAHIPELEMSVGIHTGPLSGGLVGSRSRPQFTVIGDTVNDAARVESFGHSSNKYNPPLLTRVMASETTAQLLEGSAQVIKKGLEKTEKYTGCIYEVLAVDKRPSR